MIEAAQNGHTVTVKTLILFGASFDKANKVSNNSYYLQKYLCFDIVLQVGDTPLITAAMGGHEDTIRMLVSLGATVDQPNNLKVRKKFLRIVWLVIVMIPAHYSIVGQFLTSGCQSTVFSSSI